jgi:hypothetical protein
MVPHAGYTRPCTANCPAFGPPPSDIVLTAVGVLLLVIMMFILANNPAKRDAPKESPDPVESDQPATDAVQRADLDHYATKAARKATLKSPRNAVLGMLTVFGAGCLIIGAFLTWEHLEDAQPDETAVLRQTATWFVGSAVAGPYSCESVANPPDISGAPVAASPMRCLDSPRDYAYPAQKSAGGTPAIEYVYSPDFDSNGEVTLHDTKNGRALCVTLPDTNVEGSGQWPTQVDESKYIANGACKY